MASLLSEGQIIGYPDDAQALRAAICKPSSFIILYVSDVEKAKSCVDTLEMENITIKQAGKLGHIEWLKRLIAKRDLPAGELSEDEREALGLINIDYKMEFLEKYPQAKATEFSNAGKQGYTTIICAESEIFAKGRGTSATKASEMAWRNAYESYITDN